MIGGYVQGEGVSSTWCRMLTNPQETAEGIIELQEDNARAVEAMLGFMYTFDYDCSGNDLERTSPMLFNVEVYSIAEKYGVSSLKLRAKEKFERAVKTCWDMDDLAHTITYIYSSTPPTDRGLRDAVVEVVYEHISALLKKHTFRDVLEETVGFAADVTQLMVSSERAFQKYHCPNCGKHWEAVVPATGAFCCIHCGCRQSNWSNHKSQ